MTIFPQVLQTLIYSTAVTDVTHRERKQEKIEREK